MRVEINTKDLFSKFGMTEKYLLVVVILGVGVMTISLFRGILGDSQVQVEQIKATEIDKKIVIDVGGAVIKPGVYELEVGSRLKDALISAEGYSENADREYAEKVFNLAELVSDGQKIFIPSKSGTPSEGGYIEAKSDNKLVNVNTATITELDTLWGIGNAKAESIVKNRPYKSIEELITKKVLTKQILENNEGRLSVY